MIAERIELYYQNLDNEKRNENRNNMASGVVGVSCQLVAKLSGVASDYLNVLADNEYFSSVEIYENGALNLFIRNQNDLVAFMRVRPENNHENH